MRKQKLMALFLTAAMLAGLTACDTGNAGKDAAVEAVSDAAAGIYQVTEENENEQLVMNDQPESPYWFPEQLLAWTPESDPDLAFNCSTVPLAARVDKEKLTPVNATQDKDFEVLAISIMNSSTSGNAPHGLNKFKCNTFSYWQYVDKLVYWGGSSGEGIIVAPSPDVTDMGHKNGVPVLGTLFFPQSAHGGKLAWLDTFLAKDEAGNFPMVEKLVLAAKTYGFDGWFINQESEGSEEEPLTKEHADLMREFIRAFKNSAPDLELVYYDSMTVEGEMDWQNALTVKNAAYIIDEEGNSMADGMFLNFWWTEDALADQELLKASAELADSLGVNKKHIYAGMDIQADGFLTPERWDMFEESGLSLGLYCPNWAWSSASDLDDFANKENVIWVNSKGDPSAEVTYSSETQWRGVSTYAIEKSPLSSLPFTTNFCVGNGYSFFLNGQQVSKLDWNNRSISDVLPTYRWIMEHEGNNSLSASYDVGNAWFGGNSLKLRGNMDAGTTSTIKLYAADLAVTEGVTFTTVAKANASAALSLVLDLDDGSEVTLAGDVKPGAEWTTISYDLADVVGKSIRTISYEIKADEAKNGFELYFGNITIADPASFGESAVTTAAVDSSEFDEDAMYAGVRLSWEADTPAAYYEVFRINQDGTKSLLGVSNTTCFYINTLPRTDDTNLSNFEIIPVNAGLKEGTGAQVQMTWPNNALPKANFVASRTLIAPGDSVTFTSTSSENTEEVAWTFEGADTESSTDAAPSVVYSAAGTYNVTLVAKNAEGEAEKTVEGCIVVADAAAGDLALLSAGAATEATAYVNENEAPPFAVDGDVTKKWCATGTPPHEITIDLGEVKTVSEVGIAHAEAGGEAADMNTKAYTISVSEDGAGFTDVVNVTRNTAGNTKDTFAPVKARYVKLSVIKPTQGSDTAARIYEIEVYGVDGVVE